MKKIQLLLLMLFVIVVHAQKPSMKMYSHVPPEEAKKKKNFYSTLLMANDKEVLISDKTKKGSVITVYNAATMKKTSSFTLDIPEINGKNVDWVNRLIHSDKITSIYSHYNKKEDENTIYGKITDRKNKTIVKQKVLFQSSAKKRRKIGGMEVYYSPDNSKILILRVPITKRYENEKMEMVMYDQELNKLFEKELNFPYKNKSLGIQQILLTNNGDVSIIAFWEPSKEEINAEPDLKDQMTFKLFKVTENNDELEEIEIAEKGYALSTCQGVISNDTLNEIVYFGFYRDIKKGTKKRNQYGVNGVYYIKLDTDKWSINTMKFNVVDEKTIIKIFMGNATTEQAEKRAKKAASKGRGISSMKIKGIYYEMDGSIKIISQIEYVVEVCTTNPKTGQTTCSYHYHNNQIIVFSLNNSGDLENTGIVPKQQLLVNHSTFNGHIPLLYNDKIFFVYNDHDFNYNTKKLSKKNRNNYSFTFSGRKKSRLTCATMDAKGKVTKQPMVDSWKQNILVHPFEFIQINNSSIITWGKIRKSKELVLLKIGFDGKVYIK